MKKYTITKTFELPDDFKPESMDCETMCPLHYWVWDSDKNSIKGEYVCPYNYCCPFNNEDGWKCEDQIE